MWTAIIISTSGSRGSSSNMLVGTVYLLGDDEALNLATMHDISMVNKSIHCPFMWVGDFNRGPQDINVECLGPGNELHIITPGNTPTTFSSGGRSTLIDYAVVSTKMHHLILGSSGMGKFALPFKGHIGIEYQVQLDARKVLTTRLIQPGKYAIIDMDYDRQKTWEECQTFVAEHLGSIPRGATQEQASYSQGLDIHDDAQTLSEMYSKWSMTAEMQIMSRSCEGEEAPPMALAELAKCMGRGQTHSFRTKPLCPRKGTEQFRVNPLMNQLCGIKALLEQRLSLIHI